MNPSFHCPLPKIERLTITLGVNSNQDACHSQLTLETQKTKTQSIPQVLN